MKMDTKKLLLEFGKFTHNKMYDVDLIINDVENFLREHHHREEHNGEYLVWDGINCEFEEVDGIEGAKKFIKKEFVSSDEGIHPDIESVFVVQKVMQVKIEETDEVTKLGDEENVPVCNVIFESL